MVVDVVADDKGDGLSLLHQYAGYDTFTQHARALDCLEDHRWTGVNIFFALVDGDVELQLEVLAVESDRLAVGAPRFVDRLHNGGDVRLQRIVKGREDLNIQGELSTNAFHSPH
jgi:hypothetical protein